MASFFLKSALRGRNLLEAVMGSLSKELTLRRLPASNMRTSAGRKAAVGRSRESLRFFRGLLRELEDARGLRLRVRKASVTLPGRGGRPGGNVDVLLVVPASCPACGKRWRYDLAVSRGVKCRTLEASLRCERCRERREISFCLPEIRKRD